MPTQLSCAEARRHRGLRVAILPDGARVEERLLQLSRERTVVAGKMACTLAELERELVREARRVGGGGGGVGGGGGGRGPPPPAGLAVVFAAGAAGGSARAFSGSVARH